MSHRRSVIAPLVLLTLAACGSPEATGDTTPSRSTTSANQAPAVSPAKLIQQAEAAVKDDLPDAPIWKGVTFAGSVVDGSTVCVDRAWAPGGGIDGKGGSAGYVIVRFPDATLGQPTDGVCSDVTGATPTGVAVAVQIPDALKDNPGLVTKNDLGKEWPLTVDYGVVNCESKEVGGMALKIATLVAPDGKKYALNGTAKSHTEAADIQTVWAPDPELAGLKINMQPLIERALQRCS